MVTDTVAGDLRLTPYAFDDLGYEDYGDFRTDIIKCYPLHELFMVEIRRDQIKETYYRTELVPVSIRNKKSSIGRAVVGGLLLGPAGAMVGAASGLGGKSSVTNEERRVLDERFVSGPPKLVLGIRGQSEFVNLSFENEAELEYWARYLADIIDQRKKLN